MNIFASVLVARVPRTPLAFSTIRDQVRSRQKKTRSCERHTIRVKTTLCYGIRRLVFTFYELLPEMGRGKKNIRAKIPTSCPFTSLFARRGEQRTELSAITGIEYFGTITKAKFIGASGTAVFVEGFRAE